jgi:chromosome segregation ATPase
MSTEMAATIIAICQAIGIAVMAAVSVIMLPRISMLVGLIKTHGEGLLGELRTTGQSARQTMLQLEHLTAELRRSDMIQRTSNVLESASGAVDRIEPLAAQMSSTLGEARGLLDDATQTSQSVRSLTEDLAATNRELSALSNSLADIAAELKDRELAKKLTNALSDASVLAADIGVLAEKANNFVDTPLVGGLGRAVGKALGGAKHKVAEMAGGKGDRDGDER